MLAVTSLSTFAVLFIFYFITRDALPFFQLQGFKQFFTSTHWYPSAAEPEFGALAIFVGSGLVTVGAALVAVPLGITAAEMKARQKAWKQPKPRYTRGVLAKYAHTVTSASLGAVTDADLAL